jgi:hypothetical protein
MERAPFRRLRAMDGRQEVGERPRRLKCERDGYEILEKTRKEIKVRKNKGNKKGEMNDDRTD